uniref:Uncharacterized protein n=1 Tax=Peronospora matthiolae TaxID=2874970 RepID=A0AAV1T2Q8_9STRA
MRQKVQRRLHVQHLAAESAKAAVTPVVPVTAPSPVPAVEPQLTRIPLHSLCTAQVTHEGPPPPAPKSRPEQPWRTRLIRGGRRPGPPVQTHSTQLNVGSGGNHVLQEMETAAVGRFLARESSIASAPPQPETGSSPAPASSAQRSHPRLMPDDLARKQAAKIRRPAVVTSGPALLTQQRRDQLT